MLSFVILKTITCRQNFPKLELPYSLRCLKWQWITTPLISHRGFPNFPVEEKLTQLLERNSKESVHQYAPMAGLPVLLDGIAEMIQRVYKREVNPGTEMLVTAGATQGIFTAIQALVHSGEEVVIIDPAYDCYDPAVALAGGKCIHLAMRPDFTIDWHEVREND